MYVHKKKEIKIEKKLMKICKLSQNKMELCIICESLEC